MRALAVAALLLAAGAGAAPGEDLRPAAATARDALSASDGASAAVAAADVHALMSALEAAARRRDVAALGAMLAEDCRLELRAVIDGREQVTRFTKDEYVRMLGGGYAAMRDLQGYDYAIEDVTVTPAADGRSADVRARVRETAVFQGRTLVTESDERSRVERRDGRLVFVAVTATTVASTR